MKAAAEKTPKKQGETSYKKYRRAMGLTQGEVADKTDMDVNVYQMIEQGIHLPSPEHWLRLKSVLVNGDYCDRRHYVWNGAVLMEERLRCGLTQSELERKLGVSSGVVSRWESGTVAPALIHLNDICNLFGFKIDELYRPEECCA